MNNKIKEHLLAWTKENDWDIEGEDEKDALKGIILECGDEVYRELLSESRWWHEYFIVICIDGMNIGYYDAYTTGDTNAEDTGYEFDLNSVCEVERYEVVTYKPKKEK